MFSNEKCEICLFRLRLVNQTKNKIVSVRFNIQTKHLLQFYKYNIQGYIYFH